MRNGGSIGLGLAGCMALWASSAAAQVGSALIAVPWAPDQNVQATAYFLGLQTLSLIHI